MRYSRFCGGTLPMVNAKDGMFADRASKGGQSRMQKLSAEQRTALASAAAKARWRKVGAGEYASLINDDATEVAENTTLPIAQWPGILMVGDVEIPVYVLDDGRRIVSRTGATTVLTGGKGGGNLESYMQVKALEPYMPANLAPRMIDFKIQEVV